MSDPFQRMLPSIASVTLLLIVTLLSACAQSGKPRLVERKGLSMGTEFQLTAWTAEEAEVLSAFDEIFQEFQRLEDLMSTWQAGSDLERLNAAAGKHPVPVGQEIRDVLRTANRISDWTNGKFDVTFGVMSGLWKFDYQDQDNTIPDRDDIRRRLQLIDYRDLEVDDEAGTAFLRREGMNASLGGIGKGYAVDRAAGILRSHDFNDFMIQFGGDLYVAGYRGDRRWRLGIRDPRGPANSIFAALDLTDATFSTSGDYERFFIKDGRRYHHIIDPATGEPAEGCRSVTIVTDSATVADGLSTGIFILGPETGMALIERLPGVEGVIVSKGNDVLVSSGLVGRLTLLAAPTDAL